MTAWEWFFAVLAISQGAASLALGIRLVHWKVLALERDAKLVRYRLRGRPRPTNTIRREKSA